MAGKVFGFLAHGFTEPVADERAVDVVVVCPAFVTGVVRRVDVDSLDLSGAVREQRLERDEVVALHDEITASGIATSQVRHVFEQVKWYLEVIIHHCLFSNPVQCWHCRKR